MNGRALDRLIAIAAWGTVALAALPATAAAETSSSAGDAAAGAAVAGFFALWSVFFLVMYTAFSILFIAVFVLWIIAIVDVISRQDGEFPNALQGRPNPNDKLMWLLIVLLAGVVGAVVYYFAVMKQFPLKRVRPPMTPPGTEPPCQQTGQPHQQAQQPGPPPA